MNTIGFARLPWRPFESDILGLEPEESDPVAVILAAQLRLRRHRRQSTARQPVREGGETYAEVRRIVSARDTLLRRILERYTAPARLPERP